MKKRYKQEYFNYYENTLVVCPDCGEDAVVKNEYNYKLATNNLRKRASRMSMGRGESTEGLS